MKIALIGFMGTGKSSVAQELSKKLQSPVIEMDQVVLERTQCKDMNEVFAKGGEILLREWEVQLGKEYREASNCVISCGGGVVMNKIILDYLKENGGKVIYLDTSFETISERLKDATDRPLFKDKQKAKELYDFRLALYKKYADVIVDTEHKTTEEIAKEIITLLNLNN